MGQSSILKVENAACGMWRDLLGMSSFLAAQGSQCSDVYFNSEGEFQHGPKHWSPKTITGVVVH